MNDQQDVVNKIVKYLKDENEDYEVINALDNSEEHGTNMVSVALDSRTQVNVGLPDYRDDISIYISTQITEDTTGELFKYTVNKIVKKLNEFVLRDKPLSMMFEEVPVVGFFFSSSEPMVVDDTYGKCYLAHLKYYAITSY